MQGGSVSSVGRVRRIFNQWGGTTATFFMYTHGSHDQCAGLFVALLPFIREDLGLSYLQSGLLMSAYTITAGVSQFLGGWLGDRAARFLVMAIGLGGVGLSTLAIGFSASFYSLLAFLIVMGLFAGAYHPSATSLVSGYFEESKMGRVLSVHMMGGSLGFALGPILGGIIAGVLGWRYAYILLSLPALLAVAVAVFKFRKLERLGTGVHTNASLRRDQAIPLSPPKKLTLLQVLRPVAAIAILSVLMQLVVGSAMAFIPLYLVSKYAIAPAYASMLVGIIRGGGMAGSLFGGWMSDRWGRIYAITLALFMTGPLLLLLTNLPFGIMLIIVFVIFGLFMQMRQATVQPFLMLRTPQYLRSTVFGIYFGLSQEGQSLLQPAVGQMMDTFGVINVTHVIAWISVGMSLIALSLLKQRKNSNYTAG
ncbi:MAG: MFS transporter [Chloroflexota bacterium]